MTTNQYFDKKINMKYKDKTKEQLINELAELHQYIEDLETLNYIPFMNEMKTFVGQILIEKSVKN